jgi:hypothetical protein
MGLALGAMAGMPLVKIRLIDHIDLGRTKSLG